VPVLVWSRVVIGALILVPVALAQGAWRPPQRALLRRNWHWLAAYALIEIIVPWALLSSAERRLPSSASGLLLAGPGAVHGDLLADAEVMGTAVCYAAGPLIANRHLTRVPGIAANAACLSLAAVVYTVPAALSWPHALPSASVLASLVALGAVCTAGGLVFYFWLIAEIGAARATVVTYVNPAVAVALGALVLAEPFTAAIAGSFVLILAGSVLATRRARLPESPPAPISRSPQRG
jgi:drug/metabolite transporter (DMT)-like permease